MPEVEVDYSHIPWLRARVEQARAVPQEQQVQQVQQVVRARGAAGARALGEGWRCIACGRVVSLKRESTEDRACIQFVFDQSKSLENHDNPLMLNA